MRATLLLGLPVVGLASSLVALPVSAQPQPPPAASWSAPPPAAPAPAPAAAPVATTVPAETPWWQNVRSEPAGPAKPVVTVVGGVVAGLGALTMFAASVTWLTAWAESLDVDEQNCPNHRCVEGTRGGDAYESTRDLAKATDVLLAVGVPAIGTGLSMVIIGASMRGDEVSSYAQVKVRPTGAGASLEVTF